MPIVYAVDDEMNVRRLIRQTMESEGYEVDTFATAEEALEAIQTRQPDVVFCDITLPAMDGIEFIKTVNEKAYDFRIIVISSVTSVEAVRSAFRLGICDFITKPFTPQELKDSIEQCLKSEESLQKRSREIRKLVDQKKYHRAAQLTRKLFFDYPESAFPHFLMGLVEKRDHPKTAAKHFKAAIAIDDTLKEAEAELKSLGVE